MSNDWTDKEYGLLECVFVCMNITQPQKKCNNAICSNMDELRDYHTNWSKSEKKISYTTSNMRNLIF